MFQTPNYNKNSLEKQLINTWIGNHDLVCLCKNPAYHTLQILASKLGPELNPTERKQIKLCLGDEPTTAATAEDPDIGDLETLFAEDHTEEDDG